jgi:RNA polymerase-binding transcription factor DksA
MDIDRADDNELADKMEELGDNKGILDSLEKQLKDINSALEKITKGTYGICEVSGEPIERERLIANPAARTSMKHMKAENKV